MSVLFFFALACHLYAVNSEVISIGAYDCYRFEIPSGEYIININLVDKDGSSFSLYYINPGLANDNLCDVSMSFYSETGLVKYRDTVNYDSSMYLTVKNDNLLIGIDVDIYFTDVTAESAISTILAIVFTLAFVACCCGCLFRNRKKINIVNRNHVILQEQHVTSDA